MPPEKHVTELLPAYALDALNQEEMLQVTQHISQCTSCQVDLEAYRQVVGELFLATPPAIPSPGLKQNLMRALPVKKQLPQAVQSPRSWTQIFTSRPFTSPVWSFISIFLIVLLTANTLWMWQRVAKLETAKTADFKVVLLAGTQKSPQATGMLIMSRDGNFGTLVVDGLHPLDEAHQYQLWLVQNGQRTNGGVFSVSDDGYGALKVNSARPLSTFSNFGITIEPFGGSPGPTGDKVLGGSL